VGDENQLRRERNFVGEACPPNDFNSLRTTGPFSPSTFGFFAIHPHLTHISESHPHLSFPVWGTVCFSEKENGKFDGFFREGRDWIDVMSALLF
jgi:hypothetical protein